ncbi:MAG: TetR/AcrR family transcriptional regulator [Pseudomonadota bacterium]
MGRKRVVSREKLLDAAERVVRRDGAARLTLDAVAAETGISKASVLYGFRSKNALVEAMVERRLAQDEARVNAARRAREGEPDAAVRARIALADEAITEGDREVLIALHAGLARNRALLAPISDLLRGWIDDVLESSASPRGALLAFLAAEGLQSLERFDLLRFAPEERARILDEIAWLARAAPERAPRPAPAGAEGDAS